MRETTHELARNSGALVISYFISICQIERMACPHNETAWYRVHFCAHNLREMIHSPRGEKRHHFPLPEEFAEAQAPPLHLATRARSNDSTNGCSPKGSTDCGSLATLWKNCADVHSVREYYGLSGIQSGWDWRKISALLALASTQLTGGSTGVNMELSAVGERVFAAESIIKRRIRKVGGRCNVLFSPRMLNKSTTTALSYYC